MEVSHVGKGKSKPIEAFKKLGGQRAKKSSAGRYKT